MKYHFKDIVDTSIIQAFMESQSETSGIMLALIDPEENVLADAGWQDLCTQFHRTHPETLRRCHESDGTVKKHLERLRKEDGYHEYRCKNGLNSIAVPIFIEGQHLATLFTGQFLDAEPDTEFFLQQAQRYGFDANDYLSALKKVPVLAPRKVKIILAFLKRFVNLLTRMGMEKLQQLEGQAELQKSEESMREAHQRLQDIIEFLPDATLAIDQAGKLVAWNRAIEKMSGVQKKQILGQGDYAYALPFYGSRRPLLIDLVSRPDQEIAAEYAFVKKEGNNLVAEIHIPTLYNGRGAYLWAIAAPLLNQQGQVVGAIESIRDISDRKKAEETAKAALDEAEEARNKVETILKSVADGLVVTDLSGRIVLMNRMAESLTGITLGAAFNTPLEQVFKEKQFHKQVAAALAADAGNEPVEWEVAGAPPRTIQARTAVILNTENNKTGVISILRDVTRERELDRMKNEFISTAAHELRTPLTSVLGFSEVLLNQAEYGISNPDQQKKFLAIITEQAHRLETIISDLLDLSRLQSGQVIKLKKNPCNVCDLIRKVTTPYQQQTSSHRLTVNLPEKPVFISADQDKLKQVLDNLISNAIKFSDNNSQIVIAGHSTGGQYNISIVDEGIGMTPEQVNRVFDKFYRVDASDSAKEGLGLGMAIVKSIIEAHDGEIRVVSEPEKGTAVSFSLPQGI